MKKTFNINVAGFPFIIDDDAYTLLNNYLDTLEHAFAGNTDSREIINDIESRIAELLLDITGDRQKIVTAADVENVIARIGKPEEMIEEDVVVEGPDGETISETISTTPPPYNVPQEPVEKKLFRDPQDRMLGGVCSGLGWYLNCDPTIVRLITVGIFILSMTTGGLAYLVLWIVLPEANTPLQRMQMMGEAPTVENIGQTVTENFREGQGIKTEPEQPARSRGFADTLASIFGVLAKTLVIIGLIIAIPIFIAIVLGLLGCLFGVIAITSASFGGWSPDIDPYEQNMILYGLILGISAACFLGVPIFYLIYKGMSKKKRHLPKAVSWILSILCVVGFFVSAVMASLMYKEEELQHKHYREVWDARKLEKQHESRLEDSGNHTVWLDEDTAVGVTETPDGAEVTITSDTDTLKVSAKSK